MYFLVKKVPRRFFFSLEVPGSCNQTALALAGRGSMRGKCAKCMPTCQHVVHASVILNL